LVDANIECEKLQDEIYEQFQNWKSTKYAYELLSKQTKLYLQGKIPKAKKYTELFNDYFIEQVENKLEENENE